MIYNNIKNSIYHRWTSQQIRGSDISIDIYFLSIFRFKRCPPRYFRTSLQRKIKKIYTDARELFYMYVRFQVLCQICVGYYYACLRLIQVWVLRECESTSDREGEREGEREITFREVKHIVCDFGLPRKEIYIILSCLLFSIRFLQFAFLLLLLLTVLSL